MGRCKSLGSRNYAFDVHLSYLGWGSCSFLSWVPSGLMVGSSCSGCDILCLLMWQAAFFIRSSMRSHWGCLGYTRNCCCWITKSLPTLWPHGLQHNRLPCPPLSPGVCSNSCPLSQWCHLTISSSPGIQRWSLWKCTMLFTCEVLAFFFKVKVGPWHAAALLREEGQSPGSPCCSFPISCLFPPLSIHPLSYLFSALSSYIILSPCVFSKALGLYWCLRILPVRLNTKQLMVKTRSLIYVYKGFTSCLAPGLRKFGSWFYDYYLACGGTPLSGSDKRSPCCFLHQSSM